MREHGVVDLHFDGGKGYQFISVLVSFFVVANITTSYNRFWEARGLIGKALNNAKLLADRAALYSGHSRTEKAQMWRDALRVRLIELLNASMHLVQNERASLLNLIKAESRKERKKARKAAKAHAREVANSLYKRHGLRKSLMLEALPFAKESTSSRSLLENAIEVCYNRGESEAPLASMVDAIIISNGEYLETPLIIHEKMDLLSRTAAFLDCFHGLLKFSTTPIPFVIVQMGRTVRAIMLQCRVSPGFFLLISAYYFLMLCILVQNHFNRLYLPGYFFCLL